jgi:hypothetical protein
MRTYGDLNRLAIEAVRPGGLLVTCSCSGLISPEAFMSIVRNSAQEAGATLKVLALNGAAPDHPVASNFPEGRYLKVIFAQVLPGRKLARPPREEPAAPEAPPAAKAPRPAQRHPVPRAQGRQEGPRPPRGTSPGD